MITKTCPRCRQRIEISRVCTCYNRARSKYGRISCDSYYNSPEWGKEREKAIQGCMGLDIYALYAEHRIAFGFTVHHRMIHEMYKTDYRGTLEMLHRLKDRFYRDFLALGADNDALSVLRELKIC